MTVQMNPSVYWIKCSSAKTTSSLGTQAIGFLLLQFLLVMNSFTELLSTH